MSSSSSSSSSTSVHLLPVKNVINFEGKKLKTMRDFWLLPRCISGLYSSGCYTVYGGSRITTFRDSLWVPSSKVKLSRKNFGQQNSVLFYTGRCWRWFFSRGGRVSQVAGVCSGYQGVGVRNGRHQSKVDKMKKWRRRRDGRSEKRGNGKKSRMGGTTLKVENELMRRQKF